jgi:CBS domain-containing protein
MRSTAQPRRGDADCSASKPATVDRDVTVVEASKLMREAGATELLVTDNSTGRVRPVGIVSARDIVTRVVAAELDPAVLTAGDIAWSSPDSANVYGTSHLMCGPRAPS